MTDWCREDDTLRKVGGVCAKQGQRRREGVGEGKVKHHSKENALAFASPGVVGAEKKCELQRTKRGGDAHWTKKKSISHGSGNYRLQRRGSRRKERHPRGSISIELDRASINLTARTRAPGMIATLRGSAATASVHIFYRGGTVKRKKRFSC